MNLQILLIAVPLVMIFYALFRIADLLESLLNVARENLEWQKAREEVKNNKPGPLSN